MAAPSKKKQRTEEGAKDTTRDNADFSQLSYMNGWGSYVNTEALPGAVPECGNTPQKCPYGLYAEQINGTSFTKAKHANLRTWFYRIKPSADHKSWTKVERGEDSYNMCDVPSVSTPEQYRWAPLPMPSTPTTFVEGMQCYCGAGSPEMKAGLRIHVYACNKSMVDESFASSDGDFLIVPELGTLDITTECGKLQVPSGFICVIPRGIRFAVAVSAGGARGYVAEVFDNHFETPPMGVIGANGLSNLKDFETPVAAYEDRECKWTHYQKFNEGLFKHEQGHSPFDVVAWSGNYAPYRYDLAKYCVINTVSFDHLDPSIFCVLTAQTGEAGVAVCDFVIFPPRWMVGENTFRPPYYHKNTMGEFMGNIRGVYEAKTDGGFRPGGASLHSCMAAHGPAKDVFEKASNAELTPTAPQQEALAFMFESVYMLKLTPRMEKFLKDEKYNECWQGFNKHFTPEQK